MSQWISQLLTETLEAGSWLSYIVLFGSGVITSFTPCTYPVLPLTVGVIGGMAGGSRMRGLFLSVLLVLGMAFVYAVLGTVFAALGMQFGSLWGNGWVVYLIGLFFIFMGLFLLDVFTFPSIAVFEGLRAKLDARKTGWIGVFAVGGVSALIVGPCTGPILAVVLGYITLSLRSTTGVAFGMQALNSGMKLLAFGLGQGALIVLCGTFAGFLAVLPRSGAWLVQVKKAFALLIIVGASLLLVYVGQATDFPDLIGLLASLETTAPSEEQMPLDLDVSAEEPATLDEDEAPELDDSFAPDFSLRVLDGSEFRLSQVRGSKAVVLVFFATWCPSCMAEVPMINEFTEQIKDKDILVYGVNFRQKEDILRQFREKREVQYSILLDTDGVVARDYEVTGIPLIVGVSKKGSVVYRDHHLPENRSAFVQSLLTGQ
ncbi:MAG TPA: redoxin domain-containing protein [bacterium]|nr:redoxin domain-containing protein [bacterium]